MMLELTSLTHDSINESSLDDQQQEEEHQNNRDGELEKTLTLTNGITLIIGSTVGSGIFASPGVVYRHAKLPILSLIIWIFSGILAFYGSLSYAELGMMYKDSGGEVAYLKNSYRNPYGSLLSFLYNWTNSIITRPACIAIISLICGQYLQQTFAMGGEFIQQQNNGTISNDINNNNNNGVAKFLAILSIVITTFINSYSVALATKLQDILSFLKIIILTIISITGLLYLVFSKDIKINMNYKTTNNNIDATDIVLAMQAGLWSYDGWNSIAYATEELNDPKILVKSIKTAMPLIIILYAFVNISYFVVLDKEIIENSNALGLEFALEAFGVAGGLIMPICISLSAFGASHGTLFGAGRLVWAAARDGLLPKSLSKLSSNLIPVNAFIFQGILSILILLPGNFESLLDFFSSAAWMFYFLTVFGLLLNKLTKNSSKEKEYRTYLAIPILFCIASVMLIITPLILTPQAAFLSLLFELLGIPVWYFKVYKKTNILSQEEETVLGDNI